MSRTGYSPIYRAPTSSAWRGLSIGYNDFTADLGDGSFHRLDFDTLIVDTDGISNGTDGTVPSGMAGLWQISAQVILSLAGGSGPPTVVVAKNGVTIPSDIGYWYFAGSGADWTNAVASFPARVVILDEGDDVGVWAGNSGSSSFSIEASTYLVMEYLGPTPEEPS